MIDRLDPALPLLQLFDMQTSLKFYCDVIGFQISTGCTSISATKDAR
jgi:hypothetical protein